jgi:hypothetical protein
MTKDYQILPKSHEAVASRVNHALRLMQIRKGAACFTAGTIPARID